MLVLSSVCGMNSENFHVISRETHLWYILPNEVKNASLLSQYLELLSPCEKENVLGMRGDELRKKALLARALVRTTIARCRTIIFQMYF